MGNDLTADKQTQTDDKYMCDTCIKSIEHRTLLTEIHKTQTSLPIHIPPLIIPKKTYSI